MPPASIATSQSGTLPVLIDTILPSAMTTVSPGAIGDAISPDRILAMLKIATFMMSGSLCRLACGDFFMSQAANAGVEPATVCQTKYHGDFVRHWCVRQYQRHAVVVRADINIVFVIHRNVDRRARSALFGER